jgi:hypothetical protein
MNERIKRLITKADTHAWSIADKYVARDCCHDGEVNYLWEDAFREKFAELIVRECLMVCKKTEQYEVGNQDPDEVGCIRAGAVFCRDDIKEHFGVK